MAKKNEGQVEENVEKLDSDLNNPVEGSIDGSAKEAADYELAKDGKRIAILDTPNDFGVHIGGLVHRFRRGKTPLTVEQLEFLKGDSYVKDNGASIIYR